MVIKRKEFIQVGSLATASILLPGFLKALEKKNSVPPGNKVVLVIQLSGGNDGLNTIIPITNDIYYRERPRLGISKEKALQLTTEAGINPALDIFKDCMTKGTLPYGTVWDTRTRTARISAAWISGKVQATVMNTSIRDGWAVIWMHSVKVATKPHRPLKLMICSASH